MPHPIYGAPQHKLDELTMKLWLPGPDNDHVTTVLIHGQSCTKRGSLWTDSWHWERDEDQQVYGPVDHLSHSVLCALQDWPTSQEQYDACIKGEGWAQDELPY